MKTSGRLSYLAWVSGMTAGLLVAASCMAADAHSNAAANSATAHGKAAATAATNAKGKTTATSTNANGKTGAVSKSANGKTAAASVDTVGKLLAEREALFDYRGINVTQLSQDIGATVRDATQLDQQGKTQDALDRLLQLEKYEPLAEIPSTTVQRTAGLLYAKLGKADLAKRHKDLGSAYAVLLTQRIGKGDSTNDPLRIVLINEISEWIQMRGAQVIASSSTTAQGHQLTVVAYQPSAATDKPRELYVEIDPRTLAQLNKTVDRYAAIPASALPKRGKEFIKLAHDKREHFLNDTNYPFMELQDSVGTLTSEAAKLDDAGKPQEALSKLREIERLRPIEEIPTPTLLSMYSYLVGKTGDAHKQAELRGLIFGVQQEIANSGDGQSPATAVHVILVSEEYDWLVAKKLNVREQHLQSDGDAKYDVMDVTDPQGATRHVYFDVSRLYAKYAQGTSGTSSQ